MRDYMLLYLLTKVHFFLHLIQISGGWRHTMAMSSTGKLYGWGWNKVPNTLLSACMCATYVLN